jgi:hypothetical protein
MRLFLILVLVATGCGSKANSETQPTGCDLSGTYRTRFRSSGQWMWLRFRVEGQVAAWTGRLIPPRAFKTPNNAVQISQDGDKCSFSVALRGERGTMFAQVGVDAKTNDVKGSLRFQDARVGSIPLAGVRDLGKQKSKLYCVKPGRYELSVPNEQAWKSDNKNMSCDKASLKLPFLVEYVGDELVIDQLDEDGTAAWAGEDVVEKGPCEYWVRFRHHNSWISANVTFAGDKVTASAKTASVVIEEQGGRWTCEAPDPIAWVEAKPDV